MILSLKLFLEKYNLKNQTINERDLPKIYKYKIYPSDLKITSDKGFVNIDNGEESGSHWTCFYIKDKKSFYFDSFVDHQINFYLINYLNQ